MRWGQFFAWWTYAQFEPFGEIRADLRVGHVTAALYNQHRDPKKTPEPFSPWDFVLQQTPGRSSRHGSATGVASGARAGGTGTMTGPANTQSAWLSLKSGLAGMASAEEQAQVLIKQERERVAKMTRDRRIAAGRALPGDLIDEGTEGWDQ